MTQSPTRLEGEILVASERENAGHTNLTAAQPGHHSRRRRVKTGCQTCRKRRIKCGEEKPTCSNCTKSKRYCEGYSSSKRPPLSSFGHGQSDPSINASQSIGGQYLPREEIVGLPGGLPPQRILAPNPNYYPIPTSTFDSADPVTPNLTHNNINLVHSPPFPLSADYAGTFPPTVHHPLGEGPDSGQYGGIQRHSSISGPCHGPQSWITPLAAEHVPGNPFLYRSATMTAFDPSVAASTPQPAANAMATAPHALPSQVTEDVICSDTHAPAQFPATSASNFSPAATHAVAFGSQSVSPDHPLYSTGPEIIDTVNWHPSSLDHDPKRYSARGFVQRPSFNLSIPLPMNSPPSASVSPMQYDEQKQHGDEDDDDDDDDDDEDDQDPWTSEAAQGHGNILRPSEQSRRDLGNMMMTHAGPEQRRPTRSFTTFLNQKNILATYRPSYAALPQADEKAARIFCHFVSSTGPSLSIFERPSTGKLELPGVAEISSFKQPLWTYTLPSLALDHPPLMHAILALAALHISKLQQTSPGPSIKHFAYALRRIGRLIGLPQRRNEVTTFAANLLLGYYEIMSGETSKWNIHLSGAKVLAMEIDFAGKTRKIRAMRAFLKERLAQLIPEHHAAFLENSCIPKSLISDQDWEVDEHLISTFTGYQVRYDHQYQANITKRTHQNLTFTARDVELYKMQADLYWWYCKQDIFQSMLSGNGLLMHYEHWAFCPPRGQLGQPDLAYATMDHLCLIMARLADFGGKDQGRKRRAMSARGGPPPHNSGPHPPFPSARGANAGGDGSVAAAAAYPSPPPTIGLQPSPSQGPPMGYMPMSEGPQGMHSAFAATSANLHDTAFSQSGSSQNPGPREEDQVPNLEVEIGGALTEHSAIGQAFDYFASFLPIEYQALPAGAAPHISTPFGPALQYRTHTIASIWAFYLSARILHVRLHPSMPPAAMISAQVAASRTAEYSQKIGRICAGLYYPQKYSLQARSLNPSLGGALIESTFALFFAGVQFTDPVQRGWTINKLKEIATLSGWESAASVAAGCEAAWQAMGQAGRGPPYKATMDWRVLDDRVGDKAMKQAAKEAAEREKSKQYQARQELRQQSQAQLGDHSLTASATIGSQDQHRIPLPGPGHETPPAERAAAKGSGAERGGKAGSEGQRSQGNGSQNAIRPPADGEDDGEQDSISHHRSHIGTSRYARTHWAMGLLSLDEDVAEMKIGD